MTFANELFLALEEKGHHVVMQSNARGYQSRPPVDPLDEQRKQADRSPHYNLWAPGRLTVAQVNGQLIGLLVVEVAKATVMRYVGNSTYVPEADYLANYARSRYRDDGSWSTTQEIPSGRLRLVAYSPHYRVDLLEQWEESGSLNQGMGLNARAPFSSGAGGLRPWTWRRASDQDAVPG